MRFIKIFILGVKVFYIYGFKQQNTPCPKPTTASTHSLTLGIHTILGNAMNSAKDINWRASSAEDHTRKYVI